MPILLALAAQLTDLDATNPKPGPYRPASATVMVEPVAMMFAGFDSDGDGRITRAELTAGIARSFAAADPGRTGAIGYIAFADWAERWLGDRNAVPSPFEIDRDGDNRITLDELQDRMAAIFARLDADHDGVLTHAELLTIKSSGQGDFGVSGRGRHGGRGGGRGRPPER